MNILFIIIAFLCLMLGYTTAKIRNYQTLLSYYEKVIATQNDTIKSGIKTISTISDHVNTISKILKDFFGTLSSYNDQNIKKMTKDIDDLFNGYN